MRPQVLLEDLAHQTVRRTSNGSNQVQDFATLSLIFERAFYRPKLSLYAANPSQQSAFLAHGM